MLWRGGANADIWQGLANINRVIGKQEMKKERGWLEASVDLIHANTSPELWTLLKPLLNLSLETLGTWAGHGLVLFEGSSASVLMH
jgi:hypothetical protein